MDLSPAQVAAYHRDGFLVIPDCYGAEEVDVLRRETSRLCGIEADSVFRERTGTVRSVFRVHEEDGPVRSASRRSIAACVSCR
jgi:ectoine hydroxylase